MPFFGSSGANSPWISLATLTTRLAGGFTKSAGNPVLARGGGGTWDAAELRELCPVIDVNGLIVTESDGIWAYYGAVSATPTYRIGLAKSTDGGATWTKYGSNPVISPTGTGWYQTFVFQPAVVKQDSGTRVMLAAGRNGSAADTIGCLTSTDGLAWTDAGQKFSLASFNDGAATLTQIGVPCLIKTSSGTWLMLCEALSNSATNAWRIYGATASDPTGTWTVLNGGGPVFSPTSGWENVGVANPHVIECTPGVYAMTYNGIGTVWQVGFASTTDLLTWTRYASNPILSKGAGAAWDNLEVESGFLLKEPQSSSLRIYYNGFRTSDNTAAIGLAST